MAPPDPVERARQNASGIAAIVVTGLWLSAMLAGFEYWLPLMLFGYIVVVPLVGILFDEDEPAESTADVSHNSTVDNATDTEDEALARLRERYANGELTDEQFERKVERLLETETLEDIEDHERDRNRDRERTREFE